MFLTADELVELTGYRRASAQVEWLRKQGVRHYVRRGGRPIVPRDALVADTTPRKRPNFSKLEESA